jgi:hypothetical protein
LLIYITAGSISDFKGACLTTFLKQNVAPGRTIFTGGRKSFTALQEAGYKAPASHPTHQERFTKGAKSTLPLADHAIGTLQQWLMETHHGVGRDQSQVYLDQVRLFDTIGGDCQ